MKQCSVCGIATQFPDHHAANMLMQRIADLVTDRGWIFIGPECLAVKKPRRLRALVSISGERSGKRTNVTVGLIAPHATANLKDAIVDVVHRGPAVTIKRQTHEQLLGRHHALLIWHPETPGNRRQSWSAAKPRSPFS